ncbi:modulator of DNA gyrase [Candidatus Phytoplasma mali]|uniref:Modulator of DNA gyrase n=1 Tax=Phytoplasma mali (strain AT) TaxID=482235 RepID=B3QZX4_PHYMT|nr:metallopeptidase TldD-related protein [Candidatus Phytoplasma mali]CAP18511.1 modulator of DNA gyrase [Candidatus Phytoplasma mali]
MYQKWIEKGISKGFSDLEIFINKNKKLNISLENAKIDNYTESKIISVSLKGIYKNKISQVYFENLSDDNFEKMLDVLKNNISVIDTKEPAIIFEGSEKYPNIIENNFDFSKVDLEMKINLLKNLEKIISKSPFYKKIEKNSYQEVFHQKILINSKGVNLQSNNSFAYIYTSAIFTKNKDVQSYGKVQLVKNFLEFDFEKHAKKIIHYGEKKLCGKSLKSNVYPTVFSNEMFAELLQSFSGIFNAENAYRNLTQLKDKLNEVIASPKINIIDDPLSDFTYFKEKFDDEGVACYKKIIVQKGVFKLFVNNLKTAKIFNNKPTGNGFGNGISMTNFYLEKGEKTLKEMIYPIENGIYITDLVGLHTGVEMISGDFSLQASGFKIEQGEITTPIKMIVISGNFFDILKNLKDIGNDFKLQLSGFGSASVYVGDLTIGGDE